VSLGNVEQMAVHGGYMYAVTGYTTIYKISLVDSTDMVSWFTLGTKLHGVAISDGFIYVQDDLGFNYILKINLNAPSPVRRGDVVTFPNSGTWGDPVDGEY
jgi:hypothetical protein